MEAELAAAPEAERAERLRPAKEAGFSADDVTNDIGIPLVRSIEKILILCRLFMQNGHR